ncbi:MAG: VWA domain-containing protein, partial [Deltaproteobacteria bacterium]|nr:VWA domain-containing protein [Deltaproteobacteria bacterium]
HFFCKMKRWVKCHKLEWRWVSCEKTRVEPYRCKKTRTVKGWCHSRCGRKYRCNKTEEYWGTCQKTVAYQGTCHMEVEVESQCEQPVDRSCQVSDEDLVEFGSSVGAFNSQLAKVNPDGSSPTTTALDVAIDYFEQHDPAGKDRHVVLITDGGDTCGEEAAPKIQQLRGMGVDVWVMAFQNSADDAALNQMADLGGHPLAGDSRLYRILNKTSDLAELFDEIINKPGGEVCDGLDNDCDGHTDEDLVRECATECGGGVQFCKNGVWGGCVDTEGLGEDDEIPDVPPEMCDGADNDCDGETDEGFDVGGTCPNPSACGGVGTLICNADGTGVVCDAPAAPDPEPELCDGLDNDCDGLTDEDFDLGGACVSDSACGGMGTLVCSPDKKGVVCDAPNAPSPEPEVCDGVDNDCDGQTDEGLVQSCSNQCGAGEKSCVMGTWTECQVKKPTPETCDGVDNDCDGLVDEGFDVGAACTVGSGGCAVQGTRVCSDDGLEAVCSAQGGAIAGLEVCNGKDDDCDGIVDNGPNLCPSGQVCFKGTGGVASCVYD